MDKISRPRTAPSPLTFRENLKFAVLVVATVFTAYLCYRILLPFASALIWAVALAIVARPLHRRLEAKVRNRNLCAAIVVVVLTLALVLPVAFVAEQIISQGADVVRTLRSPEGRAKVFAPITTHPRGAQAIQWLQQHVKLDEQAQTVFGTAGSAVPAAFLGSLGGLAQLAIALFTTFFLLRDVDYFLEALRCLVPLSGTDTAEVLSRVQRTIDASVRGRLLIALIQGALGGLMFWFLGLPAPVLWGAVMAFFALVPMLGAFIVWMPATLFLLAAGHPAKAAILAGWGVLVIGTADNFLYPILVGKNLRMHTLAIFFSVLGGVAAFGASGLVMGPVVFAVADALIEIWGRRGGDRPSAEQRVAA
jgi:predicted PurR-regulated permease PerM